MSLVYQGREYPTPAGLVVHTWHEHGLTWPLGRNGVRRRSHGPVPRKYVHHWTGGVGDARAVHRVLTGRGLSVQLYLGGDGVVWQYVDLAYACAHAGSPTNDESIGIETQSVGHGADHPRFPRTRLPDTVHGRTVSTSQFTRAQQVAARLLRLTIREITGLPIATIPAATVVPLWRRNRHVGDLAHYQISAAKRDPGAGWMAEVARW